MRNLSSEELEFVSGGDITVVAQGNGKVGRVSNFILNPGSSSPDTFDDIVVVGPKLPKPPSTPPIDLDLIALRDYLQKSTFYTPPAEPSGPPAPASGPSAPPSPPVPNTNFTPLPEFPVSDNVKGRISVERNGFGADGARAGVSISFR